MSGLEDLEKQLHDARRAPFLFVGAGLSRRYLKSDGWVDLLKRMAAKTNRNYSYYSTKANNILPRVATEIASEFHEIWYQSPEFADSRLAFEDRLTSVEGPLKVEVAKYTDEALAKMPAKGSAERVELDLLVAAVVDGVITTNYDELLETIFPEFHRYVGQDELLFADSQGIGEIYKIHGSASDPESLVLTAADYERFGQRNPYLAAKLLTIFVEHPIIFLGYSLNDDDVTDILVSVAQVLTTENLKRLQNQLIFVQWTPGLQTPTLTPTQIAAGGFSIPVAELQVGDFAGLFTVLGGLDRKFPAQMLRQLKEHVYELVMSNQPETRLAVIDIDDSTAAKDIEVVFGVGLQQQLGHQGYVGLNRKELLLDSLQDASPYDPKRVVSETLPLVLKGNGNTPIYRYLRGAGLLDDKGQLLDATSSIQPVIHRVKAGKALFQPSTQELGRASKFAAKYDTLAKLAKEVPPHDVFLSVQMLDPKTLDLDALRDYLRANANALSSNSSTAWAKAACLCDFLRFGPINL